MWCSGAKTKSKPTQPARSLDSSATKKTFHRSNRTRKDSRRRGMPLAKDLLYPDPEEERRKHKLKRLIQHPNSYFMDVKCPNCAEINITFSHSQTVLRCKKCDLTLSRPTGGKVDLIADCNIRRKGD